jgi:hypothetical protein
MGASVFFLILFWNCFFKYQKWNFVIKLNLLSTIVATKTLGKEEQYEFRLKGFYFKNKNNSFFTVLLLL